MTGYDRLPETTPVAPQPKGIGCFRGEGERATFVAAYRDGMALLPPVEEERMVDTGFGRVTAYRFGPPSDEPIVLLSGRQASTPMWRENLPGLLRHRTVWSMDSIGEPGATAQTVPLTGPEDQARWVDEAIAALGLERVHLMGVSIGGWLAVQTAIHRPARLASVILLDPAVTFAPVAWKMIVVSLGSVIPGMPQALRHRLLSWISGGAQVDDTIPEARLIASGMRGFQQRQPTPAQPKNEQLQAITTPMLAIIAGASIIHNPAKAAARARRVPGAQVELWPGRSHAINGEAPDEIADRVGKFLDSLPSRGVT
ncbi:alpha/beta hydrolase [Nocardia uniformis]|uniref:Alpha/beta hydrolase n=1 Tax=Nocardia uniformis TaxID=53432 RepID=A0A849C776_9NOCA|nr:alpha/beta hydrolase [Nocardia uniformis]NNH73606.1 alpha/beta hydrolase [Nocardia uniformis]